MGISALIRRDMRALGSSLWSLPGEDGHLQRRKKAFTKNPTTLACWNPHLRLYLVNYAKYKCVFILSVKAYKDI